MPKDEISGGQKHEQKDITAGAKVQGPDPSAPRFHSTKRPLSRASAWKGDSPATQLSILLILPALTRPSGCKKPGPCSARCSRPRLRATRVRDTALQPCGGQAARPRLSGVPGAQLLRAHAQSRLDRKLPEKKLKGLNSEKLGGV